ncbi:hypothetical protein [Alkalinema sp. FACHB-956]|uniref:hypothetical protein n=1 Tax=Alkalinema sp. FACHB-956 TaxID=2692768 RepID=UPI001684194F|nr:hypothetical protein [Alkalinema sp. FACHB-956]MBD2328402.1 hypothetical protein [Alkalinema sp. FACHB-956]
MVTATATRKSVKTSARKVPKHTPALQRVIPYQEKVRLMVIEVLREESGRELAASARFNGQEFDWEQHNAQFRKDYAETLLRDLLTYARKLYGLQNLDEVRDRRAAHKATRTGRLNALNGLSTTDDMDADEEFEVDLEEDINLDD